MTMKWMGEKETRDLLIAIRQFSFNNALHVLWSHATPICIYVHCAMQIIRFSCYYYYL